MKKLATYGVLAVFVLGIVAVVGCRRGVEESGGGGQTGTAKGAAPVFSLAWSEYPSWSTFGVAHEMKIIDGRAGKMGPIEKKWGVDIELNEADYDSCIVMYGAAKCDAACLTNMDVLNPALRRRSVGVLPTSTSYGADALIVTPSITDLQTLRGKSVYGLAKTVSEYCFVRNLEIQGEQERDHKFTNMDPGAAALAMQQKKEGYDAIVVWNPFVLETLNKRDDARVLCDSTSIPGEIVDMVQIAQESLDREGGDAFACAVIETFYTINERLADKAKRNDTLIALGEKFANLDLQSMEKVVQQTLFYATPEAGIQLLVGTEWATPGVGTDLKGDAFKIIMKRVVNFCVTHDIVPKSPAIGYGDKKTAPAADFRLDPTYIKMYQAKAGK